VQASQLDQSMVPLRTAVGKILSRCPVQLSTTAVEYNESRLAHISGIPGRLHCDSDGLFTRKKLVKELCRGGLERDGHFRDYGLQTSFARAVHDRHPHAQAVAKWVNHQLSVPGLDRKACKELVNACAGIGATSIKAWLLKHKLDSIPAELQHYMGDVEEAIHIDMRKNPVLADKLIKAGSKYKDKRALGNAMFYVLNCMFERGLTQKACAALKGMVQIMSYECDGMFVMLRPPATWEMVEVALGKGWCYKPYRPVADILWQLNVPLDLDVACDAKVFTVRARVSDTTQALKRKLQEVGAPDGHLTCGKRLMMGDWQLSRYDVGGDGVKLRLGSKTAIPKPVDMQIFVIVGSSDTRSTVVRVTASTRVSEVLAKVCAPNTKQWLQTLGGNRLDESQSMAYYDIQNNQTLQLQGNLLGGCAGFSSGSDWLAVVRSQCAYADNLKDALYGGSVSETEAFVKSMIKMSSNTSWTSTTLSTMKVQSKAELITSVLTRAGTADAKAGVCEILAPFSFNSDAPEFVMPLNPSASLPLPVGLVTNAAPPQLPPKIHERNHKAIIEMCLQIQPGGTFELPMPRMDTAQSLKDKLSRALGRQGVSFQGMILLDANGVPVESKVACKKGVPLRLVCCAMFACFVEQQQICGLHAFSSIGELKATIMSDIPEERRILTLNGKPLQDNSTTFLDLGVSRDSQFRLTSGLNGCKKQITSTTRMAACRKRIFRMKSLAMALRTVCFAFPCHDKSAQSVQSIRFVLKWKQGFARLGLSVQFLCQAATD
jgi:hypothetical protein